VIEPIEVLSKLEACKVLSVDGLIPDAARIVSFLP
jgi:hypothetical protein